MAQEYINSNGKHFYKSLPAEGDYKLKGKYRRGWTTAPNHNRHSDNNQKKRHKVPNPNSYAEPRVMVLNAAKGSTVMMTRAQFASLDWGWKIT